MDDELRAIAWAKLHKKAIVDDIIGDSSPRSQPMAIIMAGIPGAGKTEFLSHIVKETSGVVVIDLDAIVNKFPGYRPEYYYRYRKAANVIVSALLTGVLRRGVSFALDGTFAHDKGAENIARALKHGFDVSLFFVDQDPEFAWEITKARRLVTGRPVERSGFLKACCNVVPNVLNAIKMFRSNEKFYVNVINKSGITEYEYIDDYAQVDKYLKEVYNRYQERRDNEQAR